MSTGKHYLVELNEQGMFVVKAKGADLSSATFPTLREAVEHVKKLNPNDLPEIKGGKRMAS
jgi:hypothetical protein